MLVACEPARGRRLRARRRCVRHRVRVHVRVARARGDGAHARDERARPVGPAAALARLERDVVGHLRGRHRVARVRLHLTKHGQRRERVVAVGVRLGDGVPRRFRVGDAVERHAPIHDAPVPREQLCFEKSRARDVAAARARVQHGEQHARLRDARRVPRHPHFVPPLLAAKRHVLLAPLQRTGDVDGAVAPDADFAVARPPPLLPSLEELERLAKLPGAPVRLDQRAVRGRAGTATVGPVELAQQAHAPLQVAALAARADDSADGDAAPVGGGGDGRRRRQRQHLVQSPPVAQLLDPLRQRFAAIHALVASVVGSVATSVAVAAVPAAAFAAAEPAQPAEPDASEIAVDGGIFPPRGRPRARVRAHGGPPRFRLGRAGGSVIVRGGHRRGEQVIVRPRVAAFGASRESQTRLRIRLELRALVDRPIPATLATGPALAVPRPSRAGVPRLQGRVDAPGSRSGVRSRRSARAVRPDASVPFACPLAVVRLLVRRGLGGLRHDGGVAHRSRRDLTRTASGVPSTTPRRSPRAPRGQSRAIDRGPRPRRAGLAPNFS